jgi:hypothetical protein
VAGVGSSFPQVFARLLVTTAFNYPLVQVGLTPSPCTNSRFGTGYIGGSFWGSFFVVMSGNRWASLASAILFCLAMAISLKFSPNKTMVFLNLGFILLTVVFIVIDQLVITPFVQYLTLFYGVFIGSFSIFDIYDDLITRTVEGSDAHGEINLCLLSDLNIFHLTYFTCLSVDEFIPTQPAIK